MDKELTNWEALRVTLETVADDRLRALLDSCDVQFDSQYQINARQEEYAGLCAYYPLIETLVHEKLGKHARLNLVPSAVPMGTAYSEDSSDYEAGEMAISVAMGASHVSDAIMRPESIAAVPSYLLRFVPYVGANAVMIATALRQAFYRASRETGADQLYPKLGDSVKIEVKALLRSIGGAMSRASFFRVFQNGDMDWFVKRGTPTHRVEDGQVRREANTYHYRGILLTPGDASDLYAWLTANMLSTNPLGVLTRLLDTPRDEVLTFPFRVPDASKDQSFSYPASVHTVIEKALGQQTLDPTLAGLADRISNHLVRPESFLAVPWYWFHNVLPELGIDLGMLYLMCKNCCYIDWAHGKDRNSFWVPGGLKSLQAWIRSETLPKHIPHAQPSRRGRPREGTVNEDSAYTRSWRETKRQLASDYICRIDTRQSETGTDWKLQINDVQLTAADESLKQAIYGFIYAPPTAIEALPMQYLMQTTCFQKALLVNAKANSKQLCHFETLVKAGICKIETLEPSLICHFDTLVDGLNYYFETLIQAGICQFETILNILFNLKYTSFFKQNTSFQPHTVTIPDDTTEVKADTQADPENEVVDEELIPSDWDFKVLFSLLDPKYQAEIIALGLEKIAVAWAVQGCFIMTINNPWSLAVRRTIDLRRGPGGPAERFAALPMARFMELIKATSYRMEAGYFNPMVLSENDGQDLLDLINTLDNLEHRKAALRRLKDTFQI